jgi:hypothetical protein
MEASAAETLRLGAIETARAHSLDAERKRFHQVLTDLDAIWASS